MPNLPQTNPSPKLPYQKPKVFKVTIALVILILLLFALAVLIQQKRERQQPSTYSVDISKDKHPTSTLEIITMENGKPSPYLPEDIILEKDVVVLRSSYIKPTTYWEGGGKGTIYQIQSFLTFVTKKSLEENFSLYKKYFTNNKWETLSTINEKDLKRLTIIKGFDKINVLISQNSLTKENTIDINGLHIGTWRSLNQATSTPTSP